MSGEIKTSKLRVVRHDHPKDEQGELLEVSVKLGQELARLIIKSGDFKEEKPPTRAYNCFGLTFGERHGWIRSLEFVIADDFGGVTGAPQKGDVVIYIKDALLTHAALVDEVNNGKIIKVRSKWGEAGELIHRPEEVPSEYGTAAVFLRRTGETTITDPPPIEGTAAEADEAGDEGAMGLIPPSSSALEAGAEDEVGTLLMLASTEELRARIIREQAGIRRPAGATGADDTLLFAEPPVTDNEPATEGGAATGDDPPPPPAPPPGVDPDAINRQLTELLRTEFHHRLLFASYLIVARKIIAELPPVKELTKMTKIADSAPVNDAIGKATLKFFQEQLAAAGDDEEKKKFLDKLFSILFYVLKNSPVKEAAPVLSDYILRLKPLGLSRTLAVEAFSAAALIQRA